MQAPITSINAGTNHSTAGPLLQAPITTMQNLELSCRHQSQRCRPSSSNAEQRESSQHLSVTGYSAFTKARDTVGPLKGWGLLCWWIRFPSHSHHPNNTRIQTKVRCDVIAISTTSGPLQVPRHHHRPPCPDLWPTAPGRSPATLTCQSPGAPVRHIC